MSGWPRVLVVDDALLVREGVVQLLTAGGCEVVGTATDTAGLDRSLATGPEVDVVVLDIRMPPTHTDEGLVALESLRARGSGLGVLLLSMYASPLLAMRALAVGGATGYLLKDRVTRGETLVEAVRTIARGGVVVDPDVVAALVGGANGARLVESLTSREREVLQLMAEGRSNAGIAQRLVLSVKTVESHVEHIFDKLALAPEPGEHRRVLAVLRMLRATQ